MKTPKTVRNVILLVLDMVLKGSEELIEACTDVAAVEAPLFYFEDEMYLNRLKRVWYGFYQCALNGELEHKEKEREQLVYAILDRFLQDKQELLVFTLFETLLYLSPSFVLKNLGNEHLAKDQGYEVGVSFTEMRLYTLQKEKNLLNKFLLLQLFQRQTGERGISNLTLVWNFANMYDTHNKNYLLLHFAQDREASFVKKVAYLGLAAKLEGDTNLTMIAYGALLLQLSFDAELKRLHNSTWVKNNYKSQVDTKARDLKLLPNVTFYPLT